MSDNPKFTLTIEAIPRPRDPDGTKRLRGLLKALLRSLGFRCVKLARAETKEGN